LDTTPPVISGVTASPTGTGAVITWTTNEPSTSQVEYGTTSAYGSSTTLDSSKVVSHSQAISGLTTGQGDHYRVISSDAPGNTSVSGDQTFTPTAGGLSDNFDTNTLDPAKWTATSAGSTVA